ncbi:MAG TPA: hypothetical protein VFZ40_08775 [Pyrinomonadaceae bacterium]
MKSCPTCNRTYPDDTLAFCLMDGSVLSAPFDPTEQRIPRQSQEAPPTEIMRAATHAGRPAEPLQSTIHAPVPQLPQMNEAPAAVRAVSNTVRVTALFRALLAIRGILTFIAIVPWLFVSGGGYLWNLHPPFAAVLTLAAGLIAFVRWKRGLFLILDSLIGVIVSIALLVSGQWIYWTGTWPIVSGALLFCAAIELRNRLTLTWLLAAGGLIFGLYTVAFYIQMNTSESLTDSQFKALVFLRAGVCLVFGVILTVFALMTRGKELAN